MAWRGLLWKAGEHYCQLDFGETLPESVDLEVPGPLELEMFDLVEAEIPGQLELVVPCPFESDVSEPVELELPDPVQTHPDKP